MILRLLGFPSLEERDLAILVTMLDEDLTIRQAAEKFDLGKSTVHGIATRYMERHPKTPLSKRLRKMFDRHYDEGHIRGGEATARKYSKTLI